MRLLIELADFHRSVEVDHWRETTTVSELLREAGAPAIDDEQSVYLDHEPISSGSRLSELNLLEGSRISFAPTTRPSRIRDWTAGVSDGLTTGAVIAVPNHRQMIIGRSPQADVVLPTDSASWEHFRVERTDKGLKILDSGSTNGTLVGGSKVPEEGREITQATSVQAGGCTVVFRPSMHEPTAPAAGTLPNLTPARTAPFNRPPRPGAPKGPAPVKPPVHKDVPNASKFSWATVIAPLILAVAMVFVMGNARFALFALLSPVMAIGMWVEQRHRRKKGLEEEAERFKKALQEFREKILASGDQEAARRREIIPDPTLVLRRPALPSTEMWQRRESAEDFMALYIGTGDIPWSPALDKSGISTVPDEVKDALSESRLPQVPVMADLTDAGVIGIVGRRDGALALARNLVVQAAVHCGPADMTLGVFFDKGRSEDWSWTSWLPHTRQAGSPTGQRWISDDQETSSAMLRQLRQGIDTFLTPSVMVVIDSEVLTEGRDAPARSLLGYGRSMTQARTLRPDERKHRVPGVVIATSEEQLPASCNYVVHVEDDASATMTEPGDRKTVDDLVLSGIDLEAARRAAMNLAHYDDPELVIPGASLPSLVRLPELMDLAHPTAADIRQTWADARGFATEIGVGDNGTYSIDLVKDGPHGLVGGTTGSGKSEFLRSMVAGLAARHDPTRLNFILIDFKGGAAFTACERLPHTIGTISNLDEQLADRALRSLEAEMERRQRVFAAAGEGIDNLPAYLATNPEEPMPRLLLVVDEFAMLAKDFPDVLDSLVSVAAVGRTLGVHMILATQRPAGVVNDDILANTNMRVALRVQSREDSTNVIGVPEAAAISRSQLGRAYVKLGQDDITPVQTALVTGRTEATEETSVGIRDVNEFGVPALPEAPTRQNGIESNDLDVLIDAITKASDELGYSDPLKVWPEALGARVPLRGFATGEDAGSAPEVGSVEGPMVSVALADEPDRQRQIPAGWDMSQGNLMLIGIPGSGTTTTMMSIALTLASSASPDQLELLVLDMGSRDLESLERLPHTVAYVGTGTGAKEKQARFLRHLMEEIQQRRANPGRYPKAVVFLDGFATLKDEFSDFVGTDLLSFFYRAYAEGPSLGLYFVVSTSRAKGTPSAMEEVSLQRWVYQLADHYDYASLGVKGTNIPASVPGRCVDVNVLSQMHVATPQCGTSEAIDRVVGQWPDAKAKEDVIGQLPDVLPVSSVAGEPSFSGMPWKIPIGIREHDLGTSELEFYDGEHGLIVGPARSGKSSLLLAIAESVRKLGGGGEHIPAVWGVCTRRSPLVDADLDKVSVGPDEVSALIASLRIERGPVLLLIDDAERFDDADKSISSLVETDHPGLCIIAAGRSNDLRTMYSHWTRSVRKSRSGIILQPNVDLDGDFFGATLPRRAPVALTKGRGYAFAGGDMSLVQAMSPDDMTTD